MIYLGKYICVIENNCVPHGYFYKNETVDVYFDDFCLLYYLCSEKYKFIIDKLSLAHSKYGLITMKEYRKIKLEKINESR